MSGMSDLEEAMKLIDANTSGSDFFGPASEADLTKSSELIGINFPPSYEAFLRTLGVGSFFGAEFYGIIRNRVPGSAVPSMTWRTLNERRLNGLPLHLVPVMSSGYGPLFCLDASAQSEDGEYSVVLWSPSDGNRPSLEPVSTSFGDFFLREIIARLSMDHE